MASRHPTYSDLMKSDKDVKVTPVNQNDLLKKLNIKEGICGGLSTEHILLTLNPIIAQATKNPLKNNAAFEESLRIAHTCDAWWSCYNGTLKASRYLKTGAPKEIEDNLAIESALEKTALKTMTDGYARGVLFGGLIEHSPKTDTPTKNGHAFSFTAKKKNNEIYCAGLDCNMFFTKGTGLSGCKKVAEKMADTLEAYESHNVLLTKTTATVPEYLQLSDILSTRSLARK